MPKPPPMIDPNSKEFAEMAGNLARHFCPPIYPCCDCGGPVVTGYRCTRCGCTDPSETKRKERGNG
jgi:hypothetical protein